MWADAQRDGRQAEYRCRPLRKYRNSIPCTTPQTLADSAARVSCSNAANIGERKTWLDAKWILHVAKFRQEARASKIYIYSVLA